MPLSKGGRLGCKKVQCRLQKSFAYSNNVLLKLGQLGEPPFLQDVVGTVDCPRIDLGEFFISKFEELWHVEDQWKDHNKHAAAIHRLLGHELKCQCKHYLCYYGDDIEADNSTRGLFLLSNLAK